MSKQTVVVLDRPPLPADSWASEVFKLAKLTPGENGAIAEAMGKDPEARKALTEHGDPVTHAELNAPHYRKALAKLSGDQARVGLYGTAWVVYAKQVDACVIDWSETERLAKSDRLTVTPDQFKTYVHDFIRNRVKKYVAPNKVLELPNDLSPEQKRDQTIAFLKKLGCL